MPNSTSDRHRWIRTAGSFAFLVGIVALGNAQSGRSQSLSAEGGQPGRAGIQPAATAAKVQVTNTPNVNAKQSGPWSVAVTGNPVVHVNNTAGAPAFVRTAAEGVQPYQVQTGLTLLNGNSQAAATLNVPAGKRLVIEYLSASLGVPSGVGLTLQLVPTLDGSQVSHVVPLTRTTVGGGFDSMTASEATRVYADGSVLFLAERALLAQADTNIGSVTVSGYLVDAP